MSKSNTKDEAEIQDPKSKIQSEEDAQTEGTVIDEGQGQTRDLATEYLNALQRERADFINYRRRTEQEREEISQRASAALLRKILPIVDDFDRAVAHLPEEAKGHPWVEGVTAIGRKLHALLEQEGVEEIDAQGQPFDPNVHEAVAFEEAEQPSEDHTDRVAEVFTRGYKHRNKVLRPAMVKVTRG